MDDFLLLFIFSIISGLIAYYCLWFVRRKKRRITALSIKAMHHGFKFAGDMDVTPEEKFGSFRLFGIRVPGKMENVIQCSKPQIWIFDYESMISSISFFVFFIETSSTISNLLFHVDN